MRLLLFETYILDSLRFREIPYLVAAFGAEGLRDLVNSLALHSDVSPGNCKRRTKCNKAGHAR